MWRKSIAFARSHIILTSLQHFLAGFGLAILLQYFFRNEAFAPIWLGWAFVIFSLVMHVTSFLRPASPSDMMEGRAS